MLVQSCAASDQYSAHSWPPLKGSVWLERVRLGKTLCWLFHEDNRRNNAGEDREEDWEEGWEEDWEADWMLVVCQLQLDPRICGNLT